MTQEEIKKVLEEHQHWLRQDVDVCEQMRADLTGADLIWANLTGADLRWADLTGADLRWANLTGADLRGAVLTRADLTRANITGAKNLNIPMACPTNGSFIGWKKAIHPEDEKQLLVKLLIPDDARRSSATTSKCRCDKAQVLEITDLDGNAFGVALSNHNNEFVYRVGETVKVDDFCADRFQECAAGIHFFVDREAAIRYEV